MLKRDRKGMSEGRRGMTPGNNGMSVCEKRAQNNNNNRSVSRNIPNMPSDLARVIDHKQHPAERHIPRGETSENAVERPRAGVAL